MIKIDKTAIAIIQLRKAIQLFNRGDYISSITLAGAANEIFGQFASKLQGYNTLDGHKYFWDGFAEMSGKNKPSKDKIKLVENRIRNQLKHHDQPVDVPVIADFHFEAQCQIDSAIRNYWIAFEIPLKDRIVNRYINCYW